MTALTDALIAVREMVAGVVEGDESGLAGLLDRPEFASADAAYVPGEDFLDHIRLRPTTQVWLTDLESIWGAARQLPRRPSGGPTRSVIFDGTLPSEGRGGATVLADVDDDGLVETVVIRADRSP